MGGGGGGSSAASSAVAAAAAAGYPAADYYQSDKAYHLKVGEWEFRQGKSDIRAYVVV